MKKLIVCLVIAMLVIVLAGCCLSHEWVDATCTTPKTCTKCGETEGDTLPHTWADATCTKPKTCSVCKTKDGSALGHTTEAATCTTPETCLVCKETFGDPIPHEYTWTITQDPTYSAKGIKKGTCTKCGETLSDIVDELVPEYYWNKPVQYSEELTIGAYKSGQYYWMELKAKTMNTSAIITALRYGIADWGFDAEYFMEWAEHIIDYSTSIWESNGISYIQMSGYGREWTLYMDTRDNTPGIFGIKVNMESELESLIGVDVKN